MSLHNKLTFPVLPNHKVTGDYNASKLETKNESFAPEWDQARSVPELELVTSKRSLHITEQILEKKRDWANGRRQDLDRQWKELEEKETTLRDNFMKFNTFVKENLEKRERAFTRTEEELKLRGERIQHIGELQAKYERMKEVKELLDKKLKEHNIYENFLELVVKQSNEYKSIPSVINHYETLLAAKIQLAAKQELDLEELENARSKMMKLIEQNSFLIMGLNNAISSLNTRYKAATNNALFWENIVSEIERRGFERLCEINEIKAVSWHIYLLMCKRKNIEASLEPSQFEEQTLFIKKTLLEIKRVTDVMKKHGKLDMKSIKAEISMKS